MKPILELLRGEAGKHVHAIAHITGGGCYIGKQGEQLQIINEIFCFLVIAFNLKGKD